VDSSPKIDKPQRQPSPFNFISLTIVAILLPFMLGILLVAAASGLGISKSFFDSNSFNSVFAIISEGIYFSVVLWCLRHKIVTWSKVVWNTVKPWRFILYLLAGIGWYVLLTVGLSMLVKWLIPGFNANQQQNLGIENLHGWWQNVLAFVSLAILPPIAEETLFRGFLFKGLRRKWPFWLSAIVTSLMFAVAHGQFNVGVDVFALSLVLCYIVEKTDSIFIGITIHILKNTFAFIVLFTSLLPMLH
jgi:membrane protease YdiL (CAAX protease family)